MVRDPNQFSKGGGVSGTGTIATRTGAPARKLTKPRAITSGTRLAFAHVMDSPSAALDVFESLLITAHRVAVEVTSELSPRSVWWPCA